MKKNELSLVGAVWMLAIVLVLLASPTFAATYYWDGNDGAAGFGTATGTWAAPTAGTTTSGWSIDATGNTAINGNSITTANTDALNDALNFGNGATGLGAGTITVSGAVSAGNITFASGSGAITLSGGTSITLPATATITVNNTTDTISTPILGVTSLTVAGGILQLGATNPLSTTIVTVTSGSTLDLNGGACTFARTAGFGTVTNTGINATLTMTGSSGTVPNIFSGALNLSIQGASNVITLTGSSNYTGSTTIGTGGTAATKVILGVTNALPSGTAVTADGSNSNVALDLAGFDQTIGLLTLGSNSGGGTTTVAGTGSKLTLTAGATVNGHNNGAGLISCSTLDLNGTTQTFTLTGSVNIASSFFVSSAIQNGALTRAGSNTAGILVLSGVNTYGGATTISTGILQIAGAGSLGSGNYAGNIVTSTGTTFVYSSSANQTLSGVIGANNAILRKDIGASTLTLTNQNTYTGATIINAGTLKLAFGTFSTNILSASSALTLGGGTLQLTGTGTQTVNGLTTTANTISNILLAANETLALGALTSIGAGSTVNINTSAGGANATTATVGTSIVTTSGTLTNNFAVTDAGGFGLATKNGSNQVIRLTTGTLLPASGATSATDYRVDDNAGGAAAAGSSALAVTASESAKSITVDTSTASGILTLNSGVTLSNNIWNFGGGTNTYQITGGTGVSPVATTNTVVINNFNSGLVTFASPILPFGVNNVVVSGTGTTAFTNTNTYTGTTTFSGGILNANSTNALGTGVAGNTLVFNGGTLQAGGAITSPSTRLVTMTGNGTIDTNGNAVSIAGIISGAGNLTKNGSNILTLTGVNTFTGGLTVAAGTVTLGTSAVAAGTGTINFNTGGTTAATVQISGALTIANPIFVTAGSTGTNTLLAAPANTSAFSGSITANDNLTISQGAAQSLTVFAGGASVASGKIITLQNSSTGTITASGIVTGAGGLTVTASSSGSFVITGASTYTGGFTLQNGSAATAAITTSSSGTDGNPTSGPLGAGTTASILGNCSMRATTGGDITLKNALTLAGDITAPTVTSEKSLIFTGPATLTGTRTFTINLGTTVAGKSLTFSGNIGESGGSRGIVKAGTGAMVLSGANNAYTGATSINSGALVVTANGALGTSAAGTTVSPNAALGFSGGIDYTTTELISGSGVGTVSASGPLLVGQRGFIQSASGNNTFRGNIEINASGLSRLGTQTGAQLTLTGSITMATGVTGVQILFRVGDTNGDFVTLSNSGNNWDTDAQIFTGNTGTGAGVRLGVNNGLPTSTSISGFSVTTGSGTTFDLAGFNQTLNGLATGAGALRISNSVAATTSTLILNPTADKSSTNHTISDGAGQVALTKIGTFSQSLSVANTYTGATTINAGTLLIVGSGSLGNTAIGVNNADSTFAVQPGSGTINLGTTATAAAGASLNLGSGTVFSMVDAAIGTTNLQQEAAFAGAGLTLNSATLNFELSGATADVLVVTKTASVMGTNSINIIPLATLTAGTYNLITSASGLDMGGNFVFSGSGTTTQMVAVGTETYLLTLNVAPGALSVTVGVPTVITDVTWSGQTNGNGAANSSWNNAISNNWAVGSTASAYGNGTAVTFNDTNAANGNSAITNFTVIIANGGVTPTLTTFNNTTVNYTVSGVIGGTGALIKSGSGIVTLIGANTYNGSTTVSAGTLNILNTNTTSGVAIAASAVLRGTGSLTGTGAITFTGAGTVFPGDATLSELTNGPKANFTAKTADFNTIGGTLKIRALSTGPTGSMTSDSLTITSGGTLTLGTSSSLELRIQSFTSGTSNTQDSLIVDNGTTGGSTATFGTVTVTYPSSGQTGVELVYASTGFIPNSTADTDISVYGTQQPGAAFVANATGGSATAYSKIYLRLVANSVTPVKITDFAAKSEGAGVNVSWTCVSEYQNAGFNIYRRELESAEWVKVNPALIAGRITNPDERKYTYFDFASAGIYEYKLESIDLSGGREFYGKLSDVVDVDWVAELTPSNDVSSGIIDSANVSIDIDVSVRTAQRAETMFASVRTSDVSTIQKSNATTKVVTRELAARSTSDVAVGERSSDKVSSPAIGVRWFSSGRIGAASTSTTAKVTYKDAGVMLIPQSSMPAGFDLDNVALQREGRNLNALAKVPGGLLVYAPGYKDNYTDKDAIFIRKTTGATNVGTPKVATGLFASSSPLNVTSSNTVTHDYHDVYFDYGYRPYSFESWFSSKYLVQGSSQDFNIDLADVVCGSATMVVNLWSLTSSDSVNPDHGIQVLVNGLAVGETSWDGGNKMVQLSFAVPAGAFKTGSNVVSLVTPTIAGLDSQIAFLNSISVNYTRGLDGSKPVEITATSGIYELYNVPASGAWVVDARFSDRASLVPTETLTQNDGTLRLRFMAQSGGSGKYIVVPSGQENKPLSVNARMVKAVKLNGAYLATGPAQFVSGTQPLLMKRAKEGIRGAYLDQEQLFDYYNYGRFGPDGIRNAVRSTKPTYLLLVGRTTYDYLNYEGQNIDPLCPAYLVSTNFWAQTTSDSAFGDLGHGYPEVAVGRLPVNNTTELSGAINHIVSYKGIPQSGIRLHAVADQPDPLTADFGTQLDAAIKVKNPDITWQENYLARTYQTAPEVTAALKDAANGGADLIVYSGHGNAARLGAADPRILDQTSVQQWTGNTVFLQSTCTANWIAKNVDDYKSIAIQALTQTQGGISASIGTSTYMNSDVATAFMNQLLKNASGSNARWGSVLMKTQQWAGNQTGSAFNKDLMTTEQLFGDPAMPVYTPKSAATTPSASSNAAGTF